MALVSKGKTLTGEKAREFKESKKIKKELEEKVEKITYSNLSNREIDFILTKLRQGDYKGTDFEMFFVVFKKLEDMKK